jgi:hypothetical protein
MTQPGEQDVLCLKNSRAKLKVHRSTSKDKASKLTKSTGKKEDTWLKDIIIYLHTGNSSAWDRRIFGNYTHGILLPHQRNRTYRFYRYVTGPQDRFHRLEYGEQGKQVPHAMDENGKPWYCTATGWTCYTIHNRTTTPMTVPGDVPRDQT